jgi:hypothetical protein
MGFTSVGIGSTANYGFLQFFGTSNTLCWTANGTVGIGTTNPGSTMEVYTNSGVGGTTQLNVTSFAGTGTLTNTSVLNLRIQGAGGGMVDNIISAQYNSSGVGTYSLEFKPFGTTAMTILGTGYVGIGTNNPGAPLYLFAASTGLPNGIMSVFSSSILSSTASSYDILQRWYGSSSNASFVDLMWVRGSTGTNWESASQRFQAKTDGTWQSFIEFNGPDNNYGVTIGTGSSTSNPNSVPGAMYIKQGSLVGIGTTNPQAMLHVQGGTLVTNPTIYNSSVGGWFIIGYWDCTAAQNAGAHLKLRIMGCNGYDNATDTNQMGGETTIYLNNLNNLNTTTNANVDGLWKSEGGRPAVTQVKAVQGSSRYQYFIYALVQSYTQHSINAETTQGTIWTSQMTSTSDPGANSLTVRVLTLSTAAVGTNIGIGTTAPGYTLDVIGSSSALGTSITRSTAGISGSGRISYYNGTGSVLYWLLGSISSSVSAFGGSIDIDGDLVRIDTALKNVQFGYSVNYGNFTVNRSSASGSTGTTNGNILVYRNTTTSFYDVYLVFGSASSFVGDVIYSNASFMYLTPNFVAAPSASGTYLLVWDHSVNTYMAITNSGNVGIGVASADVKLQVIDLSLNGDVSRREMFRGQRNGTGGVQNGVSMAFSLGGNTTFINPFGVLDIKLNGFPGISNNYGLTPDITVMSLVGNGNVGIGVTAPVGSLHINGITGSGLWGNACLVITNSISGAAGTTSGTSIQLHNAFNSTYFNMMSYGYTGGSAFYITSDSLVGVTFSRGQNAWSTYSDSRMKINKTPLSSELSNILKLNPVSYLYDTDPSENVAIVTRVGFLADEVAEIYPNLVTKDSGMPYTNQEGETFIPMTMCMTNLIPYHTKAIQELAYKNDALEAKNAELTQKLDSLLAWAQAQGFSS